MHTDNTICVYNLNFVYNFTYIVKTTQDIEVSYIFVFTLYQNIKISYWHQN